jgi:lambda family phage tail tape measure protein
MATVSLNLDVKANGLTGLVDQASQFNKQMQAGANASKQAGTAGSRMAASSATPVNARQENNDYNAKRSIGGTGSGASDFARQSQGLGGLVHLYATFAANAFAAQAAFTALSEAVNTSHLATGLDQIGAVSGRALGTLSKNLVLATDGAISMKEAMSSTALASAAGMTNKQILQMGEVAKKSSQALGIDMANAMERLTKGIAKGTPELLDELGIIINLNTVYSDYAKSVGKSVTTLSDFEKKQATAMAVLKQGMDKFSAVDIPTNPYTKLTAAMTDLAQKGLSAINMFLVPVVKLLAESPTGLAAAMAGVGLILVKQALPALGSWREGLNKAAADSAVAAKKIHDNFEAFDISRKLEIGGKAAQGHTTAANEAISGVQTALGNALSSKSKLLKDAMSGSYDAAKAQPAIDAQVKGADTMLGKLKTQRLTIEATDTAHLAAMDADIAKQEIKLGQLKQASLLNKIASTEQKAANAINDTAENRAAMEPDRYSEAWQRKKIADRAQRDAAHNAIMSNVGTNTQNMGVGAAFSNLHDDIQKGAKSFDELGNELPRITTKLGVLGKANAYVGGTFRILGSAAATAFSAFMPYIGIAIAAYEILSMTMSKNSKEQEAFNKSLDDATAGATLASNVFKLYGDTLSSMSIEAKGNAIENLADSVSTLVSSLEAADSKASGFDKFIDGIMGVFGKDLKSKFATGMGDAVAASLSTITDPTMKKEFESKFKELYGINEVTATTVKDAVNGTQNEMLASSNKAADTLIQDIKKKQVDLRNPLIDIKDGFKQLGTDYQTLSNTLVNNDPMAKFGASLAAQSFKLKDAFKEPQLAIALLNDTLKDSAKIKMFPPEAQLAMLNASTQIKSINEEIQNSQAILAQAPSQIDTFNKLLNTKGISSESKETLIKLKVEGEQALANANVRLDSANARLKSVQDNLVSGLTKSVVAGFTLIEQPLAAAMAKGSIDVQKTLLSKLPSTKGTIEMGGKLEQQAIGIQMKQITSTYDLIKSNEALRLQYEKTSLETERKGYLESGDTLLAKTVTPKIEALDKQIAANKSKNLSADIKSGAVERTPEVANMLQREIGMRTQLAALSSQIQQSKINTAIGVSEQVFTDEKKKSGQTLESLKAQKDTLLESKEYLQADLSMRDKLLTTITDQEEKVNKSLATLEARKIAATGAKVAELAPNEKLKAEGLGAKKTAEEDEAKTSKNFDEEAQAKKRIQSRELEAAIAASSDKQTIAGRVQINILESQRLSRQIDMNSAEQVALEYENSRGRLSEDEYNTTSATLKLKQVDLETTKQLAELDAAHNDRLVGLNRAISEASTKGAEARKLAETELANENASYKAAKADINSVTAARYQDIAATTKQTAAMKVFEDGVNNMAGTLTDALRTATETGKYDFTSMITKMIEDLAWAEIKIQAMDLGKSLSKSMGINATSMFGDNGTGSGGGFIGQAVGSLFGGGGGVGAMGVFDTGGGGIANAIMGGITHATGAAYDNGIQAFAKGGAFTNQVVDHPTLFKFAKGTGMMGEAGPEAIMPLKRGANGSLGVVNHNAPAQPQQVDKSVTVHNNFTISGPTDSRTQMQIAAAAARGAKSALARNG